MSISKILSRTDANDMANLLARLRTEENRSKYLEGEVERLRAERLKERWIDAARELSKTEPKTP